MKKKLNCFNAEKIFSKLFLSAYADEVVNYEQLIANARKEEKDKLYPKITKLEEDIKKSTESLNNALLENAKLKKEFEEYKKQKEKLVEEKVYNSLKSDYENLQKEIEELKANKVDEEKIRKELKKEYEVKLYLKDKLDENKDKILQSFMGEVVGNSEKEVDESIKKAIEKTLQIKKDLGLVDENGEPIVKEVQDNNSNQQVNNEPQQNNQTDNLTQGVFNKNAPSINANVGVVNNNSKSYTPDDIKNMSREEYEEFRKSLGLSK